MAHVSVNIHLSDGDKPFADSLDSGTVALWLSGAHRGPTLIGTPEQLLEVRRAIGRFLFLQEFGKPEVAEVSQ